MLLVYGLAAKVCLAAMDIEFDQAPVNGSVLPVGIALEMARQVRKFVNRNDKAMILILQFPGRC